MLHARVGLQVERQEGVNVGRTNNPTSLMLFAEWPYYQGSDMLADFYAWWPCSQFGRSIVSVNGRTAALSFKFSAFSEHAAELRILCQAD